MNDAIRRPGPADPLGATLLFSLLLHGVLLLGLTFHFARPRPGLPTLDVTLVDVANRAAPDRADFLAQANNQGGGQSDKAARPSQPFSGPLPKPMPGTASRQVRAAVPQPRQATPLRRVTSRGRSSFAVDSDTAQPTVATDAPATAEERRRQQEMAQLAAEVNARSEAYAKRPKKKFISANTREYAYAAYMRGWVNRVERIGNLNYPAQAREQGLHGDVELTVGLNRDGTIHSIDVIHGSGHDVLDRAARAIVRLSAPFPPLPAERKERVDILYITRTWEFQPDNVLRNR